MSERSSALLPIVMRLLRPFWPITVFCTLAGIASGLATAFLLATINANLHGDAGITHGLVLLFIGLFVLTLAGEITSDIGNTLVGQKVIANLRDSLSARLLQAPILEIERYQSHRILTVLNQDINTISNLTFGFSGFAIAAAVLVGCFAYMCWLSPLMFVITLIALALGSVVTGWARGRGMRSFAKTREAEEELQKQYRAIIEGAKELRLDKNRRVRLYEGRIQRSTKRIVDAFMSGVAVFCSANAFGSALYFFVIGLLLVMQASASVADRSMISGFVIALLYVRGPLTQIIGQLPMFSRAQIAMTRLSDLASRFEAVEGNLLEPHTANDALGTFEMLTMRDISFTFPPREGESAFTLGPINLTLKAGEIFFITGENGGGKTTLIKLLLGLYAPTQGQIRFNDRQITVQELDGYRQSFATVFSDYFLFDDLSLPTDVLPERVAFYLDKLDLAHKLTVEDGRYSTTALSTGQRKRLALIEAWLKGRPIIVFDEWAADQDPEFRHMFYTEILPELKAQGRTIVAISHDDRYFHICDRRVTLRNGRIVELVQSDAAVTRTSSVA
ncbi:cyclic peptide transporter [Bordetella genomosp. 10]|uniref:Cyclic peptide transporter n=1 Tax=Bordetella genomosp. 10 TaxID=1416804 RepID=A0A261SBG0_9BORD|nr:cyclic peptide export ABC transporter [Bordetella genomosp. 10]OZI34729.1 cyclic peptide transporter [Bordetella genomosp. 10]